MEWWSIGLTRIKMFILAYVINVCIMKIMHELCSICGHVILKLNRNCDSIENKNTEFTHIISFACIIILFFHLSVMFTKFCYDWYAKNTISTFSRLSGRFQTWLIISVKTFVQENLVRENLSGFVFLYLASHQFLMFLLSVTLYVTVN